MMTNDSGAAQDASQAARIELMRACAYATEQELKEALGAFEPLPAVREIRPAECGLVMTRGRVGGDGNPFNIGEALVTRASVALEDGTVGHAYHLGRSFTRARIAATLDALGQDRRSRLRLQAIFVSPVMTRLAEARKLRAEQAAATRVDFFTLARGDDE